MALFLRRREGESIVIGDGTLVTVCRNRYGQFGLLTSAPSGVRVDRLEVYHARGNVDQPHWHDIEQPGDS